MNKEQLELKKKEAFKKWKGDKPWGHYLEPFSDGFDSGVEAMKELFRPSEADEKKWREDCRKAIVEFDDSGALATSEVPDALRHAYFRAGYIKACRARHSEIDDLSKKLTIEELKQGILLTSNDRLNKEIESLKAEIAKRDELLRECSGLIKYDGQKPSYEMPNSLRLKLDEFLKESE